MIFEGVVRVVELEMVAAKEKKKKKKTRGVVVVAQGVDNGAPPLEVAPRMECWGVASVTTRTSPCEGTPYRWGR